VLTFARGVDGDRVKLAPKHVVGELARIMAQTFPRNIDIQTDLPADLWSISGDATQLHQVLLNLCVNSRDAMPNGGRITISAENANVDPHLVQLNPGARLGPHVVFRVADTGSGNSARDAGQDFRSVFYDEGSGERDRTRIGDGPGIVKSHAGFLTVQSEANSGTTFAVFYPRSRRGDHRRQPGTGSAPFRGPRTTHPGG
jgi:signal transduction histidine kinase